MAWVNQAVTHAITTQCCMHIHCVQVACSVWTCKVTLVASRPLLIAWGFGHKGAKTYGLQQDGGDSDVRGTDEPMHSHMGSLCICAGLHRPSLRLHATMFLLSGKSCGGFVVRRGRVYRLGQGRNTYKLGQAIKDDIDAFVTSIEIVHRGARAHTMVVAHLPHDSSHAVLRHLLCGIRAREQGLQPAARLLRPQWRCQASTWQ